MVVHVCVCVGLTQGYQSNVRVISYTKYLSRSIHLYPPCFAKPIVKRTVGLPGQAKSHTLWPTLLQLEHTALKCGQSWGKCWETQWLLEPIWLLEPLSQRPHFPLTRQWLFWLSAISFSGEVKHTPKHCLSTFLFVTAWAQDHLTSQETNFSESPEQKISLISQRKNEQW